MGRYGVVRFEVRNGVRVAVKRLKDGESAALHEANMLATLVHPCIPTLVELIGNDVVMLEAGEYCLTKGVVDRFLTVEDVDFVCRDVAAALAHMHRLSVVHRDVKCDNVVVRKPEGGPARGVLVDFNLATVWEPETTSALRRCGTRVYAAPELYARPTWDGFAADVWGFGMTFYVSHHMHFPFRDSDPRLCVKMRDFCVKDTDEDRECVAASLVRLWGMEYEGIRTREAKLRERAFEQTLRADPACRSSMQAVLKTMQLLASR